MATPDFHPRPLEQGARVPPDLPASMMAPQSSLVADDAVPAATGMNERWAEAARHVLLGRVLPGLRHDVAAALAWPDSSHDARVSLRDGVDQAARLLAREMSENALTVINGVADGPATAAQRVMRSVFIGALLAFCDQHAVGGALELTFQEAAADSPHAGRLQLRLLPGGAPKSPACPDEARKPPRLIGWPDVQAMAASCGVQMAHGDGWLTLDLPGL